MRRNHPAALIGVGFGMAWMIIGVSGLPVSFRAIGILCVLLAACGVGMGVWRVPRAHAARSARQRALMLWSIGSEFVAIGVCIATCVATFHTALIWPIIALIVGLHFLPLAFAFNELILLVTGSLTSLVAIVSLGLHSPFRMAVLGFGSGFILWGTILYDAAAKASWRKAC